VVSHKLSETHRLRPQEERGQAIVLVVMVLIVLFGFAALVIDVGYAYYASRSLQASADAAALAAAQELPDMARAVAVAREYSASAGNKNVHIGVHDVTTTVTTKCVVSFGGCDPVNAVVVLERAPTKTFFAGLLGIDTFTIRARATAAMRGGKPKPAHIMLVIDRTGSMEAGCTAGGTKIACAKDGLRAFLNHMDPGYDKVGLVAFPPSSGTACSQPKTTNGWPTDYDIYPNGYNLVPLSNDYKTSASSPLVAGSALVSTVSCLKAGGTTVFTSAIDKARATLAANHDPEAQDVLIFFTDGEANYGACTDANNNGVCENNSTSPFHRANPCRSAVTSADAATGDGVWVYGIAYDTPGTGCLGWNNSSTSCNKQRGIQFTCAEVPAITANTAVSRIASDPDRMFFSSPNPGDLTAIFTRIALDLTGARLIPDDAT